MFIPTKDKFDFAQICTRGHVVNDEARTKPEYNESCCSICGAKTIIVCPKCKAPIRGQLILPPNFLILRDQIDPPLCCHSCGKSYPWRGRVESRLKWLQTQAVNHPVRFWGLLTGAIGLIASLMQIFHL